MQTAIGGYFSAGDYAKHTINALHINGVLFSLLWALDSLNQSSIPPRHDYYQNITDLLGNGLGGGIGTNGGYGNETGEGRTSLNWYVEGSKITPEYQNGTVYTPPANRSDGSKTCDALNEALYAADYLHQIVLPTGQMFGSIESNSFHYSPPDLDTDNVINTTDDRFNEHNNNSNSNIGPVNYCGVTETAAVAAGFAALARWCPGGYAPGGSPSDPYAGDWNQWVGEGNEHV